MASNRGGPGYNSWPDHVRFVANEVTLGQVYRRILRLSSVSVLQPMLHTGIYLHVAISRRTSRRNLGAFTRSLCCYRQAMQS